METVTTSREAPVGHAPNGVAHVGETHRHPGRPSTVAAFAPQIKEWLRSEAVLSGAELLRRARLAGYRGGKSALYELVRRLRQTHPTNDSLHALTNGAAAEAAVVEISARPVQDAPPLPPADCERGDRATEINAQRPPVAPLAPRSDESREPKVLRCRCGGLLRFDLGHLADAERLGLRDQVPLLWKCMICGRSRRSDESYPLTRIVATLHQFASMGSTHDAFEPRNGGYR
jgi:hypothetical protein